MNEITTLLEGRPLSQDESQKLFRHLVKGEPMMHKSVPHWSP